jgi:hypothetical protein
LRETVSLELIGNLLRWIRADQRTLRMENELARKEMGRLASRDERLEVSRVLANRIVNFDALIEARFAHLATRFDTLGDQFAKFGTR